MTLKRYRLLTAVMMVIVAAAVGWAVVSANIWIPAPVIVAAIVIGILVRKRVKELAVDERVTNISEKALALASGIFLIVAVPIGLTLVALGQEKMPELEPIGLTLAFSACGLVLIYYIAHIYYNRKYSGKK